MARKISIVGAGVAGLVLGQCLRRRRIPAVIWEKSKHYPGLQNFGITLQPRAYEPLLRALEIDEAVLFEEAVIKPVHGQSRARPGQDVRVNRSAFLALLARDLDVRWSHKLTGIRAAGDRTHRLTFEDEQGREVVDECETVIAADGVHSALRRSLGLSDTDFELKVLPFVVYNGKRKFAASNLPEGLNECLVDPAGLSCRSGGMLLQITSGYHDPASDEVAVNYTLSRDATDRDQGLLERSKAGAETLAKRFIDEAGQLRALADPFKTIFDPSLMQQDRLLHWLMRSGMASRQAVERLARQNIFLLGDAAHPTPILGGAGANYAILSSLRLTEMLDQGSIADSKAIEALCASWSTWLNESDRAINTVHE